jgi:hypothetical protein
MEEYEWNELVYNSKFSFEPVIGEIYHLYRDAGLNFLSLIATRIKEHIGTFKLNSEKNGYYSIKKCGRTANNKLLVLIKKPVKKKKRSRSTD